MNTQKQILIVGAIFIIILSIFSYNVRAEYKQKHTITTKEIKGISKIVAIHTLDILIKNIRGITQLNSSDASSLKKSLFISEENIVEFIKDLEDSKIEKFYTNILKEKEKLSKDKLFQKYTALLKLLEHKRIDVAEKSHLLFESDKEISFLMTTSVVEIPKIIENIGKVRGIGVSVLENHTLLTKNIFMLNNNIYSFLETVVL